MGFSLIDPPCNWASVAAVSAEASPIFLIFHAINDIWLDLLPLILWRPVCFQFHDFEVYKRSGSYSSLTIHLLYNHALSLGLSFKFTEVREHWITWVRFFSVAVAESSHVRPYCVFLSLVRVSLLSAAGGNALSCWGYQTSQVAS